jgi:hypothetical protein
MDERSLNNIGASHWLGIFFQQLFDPKKVPVINDCYNYGNNQ